MKKADVKKEIQAELNKALSEMFEVYNDGTMTVKEISDEIIFRMCYNIKT